jgi:hypothetical protein
MRVETLVVVDWERRETEDGEWKLVKRFQGEEGLVTEAIAKLTENNKATAPVQTVLQTESMTAPTTPDPAPMIARRSLDSFTDNEADVWAKFVLEHYGQRLVGEEAEAKITEAELLADRVVESLRARRHTPNAATSEERRARLHSVIAELEEPIK